MINLRPTCAADEPFLYRLFCSIHSDQFAMLNLPRDRLEPLLKMQFGAQQQQYKNQFPEADFDVILDDAEPIGNLYALRGPKSFVLIDISLFPEHRNSGIGAVLVGALIASAHEVGESLHAHVLKQSRAWRLWQRMGFQLLDDDGVYLSIENPAATICKY